MSNKFIKYCEERGIIRNLRQVNTPQQNRVSSGSRFEATYKYEGTLGGLEIVPMNGGNFFVYYSYVDIDSNNNQSCELVSCRLSNSSYACSSAYHHVF